MRRACRTYALRHDKGVSASTANRPIGHCRKPIAGVIVERVAGEGLRCVECGATAVLRRTAGAYLINPRDECEPLEGGNLPKAS